MEKVNHGAVWVSVILMFVLGFVWYGALFSDQWMTLNGLTQADAESANAGTWVTNIISTVIIAYGLAWLVGKTGASSGMEGAMLGLIVGFVFNLMPTMTNNMFALDPYGLTWLTGGFSMLTWTVTGYILGAWKKKGSAEATPAAEAPASSEAAAAE